MTREAIQYLPLDRIVCTSQVRETELTENEIVGLARSIQEIGMQQPIRVRRENDLFVVVDGHRRLAAVKKIPGATTIAAIVEERELCEAEVIQRQLIANCQRVDLTPLERSRGIHRLMETTGWTATQAAGKLGLSNSAVSKLLALLSLPDSIQERVEAGAIAATAGYQLTRVSDPVEQEILAKQVANGELRRDDICRETLRKSKVADKPATAVSRATAVSGGGYSVTVAGPPSLGMETFGMETFISAIDAVSKLAKKMHLRGVELQTFCRLLREEAKA